MTAKETIAFYESLLKLIPANPYSEAAICSIKALEKQIPKKPKGDYHSCPHYRCPSCNKSVKLYAKDETYPHCAFCGQALDWRIE